ncbi:hypothetical protein [Saccharothrix xinjiangensis]|uniref:Uncharacterized protein n=1 Tax=Saccharothrix xinjiangensis TaxID=204798 RepID=A0ABV9Y4C6_9PSEU
MTKAQRIAAAWAHLPAAELLEQVRGMVKAGDAGARAVWAVVREDPVVAARVRGAMAGLKAEYRGHRDESMWLLWINRAQRQLAADAAPVAPVAVEVVPAETAFDATPFGDTAFTDTAAVDTAFANAGFGEQATGDSVFDATAFKAPEVVAPRPQASAPALLFQEPTTA